MTEQTCMACAYAALAYQRLECRVKPPSPNYKNYGRMFPIVNPDDWCARYKLKDGTPVTHEGSEFDD
jgi:hypothetical protein